MANIQDSCTDNSSCGDLSCYSSSFSSNDGDISGSSSSDNSIRETHSQPSFGVAPYMFEPLASETDTTQSETDEDYIDLPVESRIGNIDWCKCSHCITMDTNSESMCCREIPHVLVEMESDRGEGCKCITEHPFFSRVCLDVLVLRTAYLSYKQDHGHGMEESPDNERNRYVAYRQFVRTCWGYLGRHIRVPLPSCAVHLIRSTFPSETYTGFQIARP